MAEIAPGEDEIHSRFKAVWAYCMIDHGVGTLPSGPCMECISKYAITGPPDGRWNRKDPQ